MTSVPPRRNVELKTRDPEPGRTLRLALTAGAEDRGLRVQRDAYFAAAHGRLKRREKEPAEGQLIAYERADGGEARESRYRTAPALAGSATAVHLERPGELRRTVTLGELLPRSFEEREPPG